ncbi:MAG: hypothetical protein AVDCRST_MAG38-1073, partial [uncultured Solirubrobacteraceae bacterium]
QRLRRAMRRTADRVAARTAPARHGSHKRLLRARGEDPPRGGDRRAARPAAGGGGGRSRRRRCAPAPL